MASPRDVPGIHKMNPVKAYERGVQTTKLQAQRAARQEVLDILEAKYMNPDIERNSPEARAILEVARGLAEEYRARGV